MMLMFAYIFHQAMLFQAMLYRPLRGCGLIASALLIVTVYSLKPDTFDILTYTNSTNYPWIFEPAFELLLQVAASIARDSREAILIVQLVLAISIVYCLRFCASVRGVGALSLIYSISSIYFVLAVNNNLRQGFAAVAMLLLATMLFRRHHIRALLFAALGAAFHSSSVFFAVFILGVYFFQRALRNWLTFYAIFACIGFLLSLFLLAPLAELFGYGGYLAKDSSSADHRTPLAYKVMAIGLYLIISEYWLEKISTMDGSYFSFLRATRVAIYIITATFLVDAGYDELGARLLFFYFAVEALLGVRLLNSGYRLVPAIFIAAYAVAPNAHNILVGV